MLFFFCIYCERFNRKKSRLAWKTWHHFFIPRVPWEPFAPPHLFSAIYLNVQFSEKKNRGKNNSEKHRERSNSHPPDRLNGAAAGYRRRKQLPVSVWMKWVKKPHRGMFMYHAHVTIICRTDSKGIQKGERLDSGLCSCCCLRQNGGHSGGFPRISPGYLVAETCSQLPRAACARSEKISDVRRNTN